jgi:predicted DNA-binding protein
MERQKKYRQTTLAERGARNVSFVAEREDLERLDEIERLTGASKTGAIRKALEHYLDRLRERLK